MSRLYIGSEIGKLRRVLLHAPGQSLRRLTPSNCNSLLFDDVPQVEKAEKEHLAFQNILRQENIEVLLLGNLLAETLTNTDAREWLLGRQITEEHYGSTLARKLYTFLFGMESNQLATTLIAGLTVGEFKSESPNPVLATMAPTHFIFPPTPNHLFTRDTSSWIYGGVSLNPMAKAARRRETLHMRAIYKFHLAFQQADFQTYYGDSDRNYTCATIEGGDVLVLGHGAVLIGLSERTTPQGVENLAKALFHSGQVNKVITLQLPKHRHCMHLDTVFSQMDIDCFSYFPEVINKNNEGWLLTPGKNGDITFQALDNVLNTVAHTLKVDQLRLVPTGGDFFEAEREQWHDANNVLALRLGTVVTYDRNPYTIENMQNAGIEVLTISGDELGRGRGGTRCMSCPLERDALPQ